MFRTFALQHDLLYVYSVYICFRFALDQQLNQLFTNRELISMAEKLPEYVLNLLDGIAVSEGFTQYTIETAAGSKHGDGMCGIMTGATIIGDRQIDGQTSTDQLHLLCKVGPESATRRKEFNVEKAFTDEVFAHTKILPLFAAFQQEKGLLEDNCFRAYPKCYAAVADVEKCQFAVIMEDLKARDFVMWPKRKHVPKNHVYSMVERLAKFHAISFALRDQRPDEFESLRGPGSSLLAFFENCNTAKFMYVAYDRAIKVLKDPAHVAIIREVKDRMVDILRECLSEVNGFSVVGHGDFWINNMLFQYNEGEVISN